MGDLFHPRACDMHTMAELASLLKAMKAGIVYLSHEPEREQEAREFASKLKEHALEPLVAADFRKHGQDAVSTAIGKAQFTLVLAFDPKTVNTLKKHGIPVIDMRLWET